MSEHIPDPISAGITLDAVIDLADYPAPTWSLTLALRGPQAIDLTATPDGTAHLLQATAAATAAWAPGDYWYALRVSDGVDVVEIDRGQIVVVADLAQMDAGYDGRDHVARVLAAIEAVIEGRASTDQRRYRINNRELERTPIADLLLLRDRYRAEARQARASRRGQSLLGRRVQVSF